MRPPLLLLLLLPSLSLLLAHVHAGRDFYGILGVERGATLKEIRKAFKRLALEKHPDKNPRSHDEFLEINRAFEVLKDPETRQKYDHHGEEGLNEQHGGGSSFQGWRYFNEDFGLYDDDPQIEPLSGSDFWDLVFHSDDPWFVNFYSPGRLGVSV
jgi:DnaJ family protein C protein 10